MVEDKYSKNWRESQKTKETFSYFSDVTHDELKQKVQKHIEEKSKEPIELGDYFYVPSFFTDREKGTPVEMVYRYLTKEKALTRLNAGASSGGGNKQFAPRKEFVKSFEEIIEVELHDYAQQTAFRKEGKVQLLAGDLGDKAIQTNEQGIKYIYMGKPFKVEL